MADIFFYIINNTNIQFIKKILFKEFIWLQKPCSILKKHKLLIKKTFTKTILNRNIKLFVIYITIFLLIRITIYLIYQA